MNIHFIYISLFIVSLLIFIYIQKKSVKIIESFDNFKKCDYDHMVLNKTQLNDTKELLLKFIEFTEERKMPYFAIGGTLLGCIRNGGLLPFDDDIDVSIFEEDEHHVINYKDDKYYFEKQFFGYKFFKKNSTIFIDVMVLENKNNRYNIVNNSWPEYYFELNEIYPLQQKKFSGIYINIPVKYSDHLDRSYPNWKEKIKIDCGHHKKNDKCIYESNNIPQEFDIDYDNGKYRCYVNL
jgi:hypothetical protein